MQRVDFNEGWRFSLNGGQPEQVHLPHDWSIGLARTADSRMTERGAYAQGGDGEYTKTFIPNDADSSFMLEFEGVYMNAEVYINDNRAAFNPYGYTAFIADLTPYIKRGVHNEIKVLVSNNALPNTRWYSGSGIYRPVYLLTGGPAAVKPWGVFVTTPEVSQKGTKVHVRTEFYGSATIRHAVFDAHGALKAQAQQPAQGLCEQVLTLPEANLWDIDSAYLYTLKTDVLVDDAVVDSVDTRFGVRTVALDAQQGFMLNGRAVNIKGGCVHHDCGTLGAASYARAEYRKVESLRAAGFNMIRCAHNPPSSVFLDACDELGMLVMDEAFDCWAMGKTPYDYHLYFNDWWQRDMESMLKRDRNHPSIAFWSTGNEIIERSGQSDGYRLARELAQFVRDMDPSRLVTNALCGVGEADGKGFAELTAPFVEMLDVVGYNYLWERYEEDLERYPDRLIFGTETVPGKAYENWKLVEAHPRIIGDCVWTSMDYLGEAGIGHAFLPGEDGRTHGLPYPWHLANCGDLDICCRPRPQSYYRQILWGARTEPYIAVHRPNEKGLKPEYNYWGWDDVLNSWSFPGFEGKKVFIDVYSDAGEVELFINGKSQGRAPVARNMAAFELKYMPGKIRAVAYKDGAPAGEDVLKTCGAPYKLVLSADRRTLDAQWGDLAYITAAVVDEMGMPVPYADTRLYFSLCGQGTLLAVGTNDPVSCEPYTGNTRKAFEGTAMAVLRSDGEQGSMTLTVSGDGLEAAQITVEVE